MNSQTVFWYLWAILSKRLSVFLIYQSIAKALMRLTNISNLSRAFQMSSKLLLPYFTANLTIISTFYIFVNHYCFCSHFFHLLYKKLADLFASRHHCLTILSFFHLGFFWSMKIVMIHVFGARNKNRKNQTIPKWVWKQFHACFYLLLVQLIVSGLHNYFLKMWDALVSRQCPQTEGFVAFLQFCV